MKFSNQCAVLVIDAQEGFMNSVFDVEKAVHNIEIILQAARKENIPIIHSQEMHRKEMVDFGRELDGAEGIHCLEGTRDVEIIERLRPLEGEYLIKKRRYSCFFATDLDLLLRGLKVDTLIICGFLTDVCVHYTSADAHQHDYFVRVVSDAVSGSNPEAHEGALKAIRYLQSDASTVTNEVVNYLETRTSQLIN